MKEKDKIPKVTHSGVLNIMGIKLKVFILNDGRRVIEKESMELFFEAMTNPDKKLTDEDAKKVAEFCKLGKI